MASNFGILGPEYCGKEYFDDEELLSQKLDLLAKWVRESKHCIIVTGAGISTSTGIPDFRSGLNTVLATGPGVWELREKGVQRSKHARTTSVFQAVPSIAHMAVVQLQKNGLVKFVVSQNTDGLHLRSGLPADCLAELHGNTNLEICQRCDARYLRDFGTRNAHGVFNHDTGRLCDDPNCKGKLKDSIINFGEILPHRELSKSYSEANMADLCLVLGSSLRVSPANEIPRIVESQGGKLVIGNLQKTPLHSTTSLSIHAMCDEIMEGLLQRLQIAIPKWELQRRVKIQVQVVRHSDRADNVCIKPYVVGLDITKDIPYSFLSCVTFSARFQGSAAEKTLPAEPFHSEMLLRCDNSSEAATVDLSAELRFHGHYGETPVVISDAIPLKNKTTVKEYHLYFNPLERKWRVVVM